jgi:hypothetical protein
MAESFDVYQSIYRLRWVGYCFLLFALIDSVLAFIPPNFNDLTWRLQTIGKLVETVAIPILGFALVFWGEYGRKPFEKLVLKILSWFCLVLSLFFLLLIPPVFLGGLHLETQLGQVSPSVVEQQLTRQAAPVLAQLKQLETQLNQSGPEQVKNLGAQLGSLGVSVNTDDPEKLKSDILAKINQIRGQTQDQIKAQTQIKIKEVEAKQLEIRKNSVKWSLGALIAGVLFFILWRSTPWARS